jgi:site-specific recombinase XerD
MDIEQERVGGSEQCRSVFRKVGDNQISEALGDTLGQYNDSVQSKSKSIGAVVGGTDETVDEPVEKGGNVGESGTHTRDTQHDSGQLVKNVQSGGLFSGSGSTATSVARDASGDRLRSIRFPKEPPAPSILYSIFQRQTMFSAGRVQYFMDRKRSSVSSSSSSGNTSVVTEDSERTGLGSGDCPALDRSTMDDSFEIDDSEDEDSRDVISSVTPGKVDGKVSRQTPSGRGSGISSARRNDEGEKMVLAMLEKRNLGEVSQWFLGSIAQSTLRNYRRAFTLFSKLMKEEKVSPMDIVDAELALSSLVRVLKVAFKKKLKVSAVSLMKTAMVKLFSFMFNVDLSEAPILRMAMRSYVLDGLPKKEMLRLQWSVEQLFGYLRKLPPFGEMQFGQLIETSVVLCLAFSALRFTEMMQLVMTETEPGENMDTWKFWLHIKGHDYKEAVVLHGVEDTHLDPVRALVELRKRIRQDQSFVVGKCESFWQKKIRNSWILMSYDEVRRAAANVLQRAGINDKRPYHIKHAVLTCLNENGASAKDIAAFARHRYESMTLYKHYISYDGGKSSVQRLVDSKKM